MLAVVHHHRTLTTDGIFISTHTKTAGVIAVVAAAAALTCAAATTASAAPGATGSVDIVTSHQTTETQIALRAGGWAYNRHTVPVQQVRVLSYNGSGRLFNTTYLIANRSRPDVVRAGAATTPHVGFDSTFNLSQIPEKVCVDTHDKGEAGGWVRLGSRVTSTTCRSARPAPGLTPVRSLTLIEPEALPRGC